MSLSLRERISAGPVSRFPAFELAGPMRVTQKKSKLQHLTDAYGSPPAHEGIGLVKAFMAENSAAFPSWRTLYAVWTHFQRTRGLRGNCLEGC